ncbi:hypothetical protein [Spirosoma sp. 48-14]|uniref:hypothetical protein n=1 Tax=Spirosoma sp. 48-14 TaxID=1895854 RepID=UPI000966344B|nr:hypothetical protein [Spirosoma sp. 48-14]OJW75683.1 MAG: hypothetical protein BGO59_08950 [Spirosoma sp. 48-14]
MKKLIQTRFGSPDGNCFPTCLACLLDYDNPDDFLQFQLWYDVAGAHWMAELQKYLIQKHGVMIFSLVKPYDGMLYLRGVETELGIEHETIWKDGELFHDPNPNRLAIWSDGSIHPVDQQFLAFADERTFRDAFEGLFVSVAEFTAFWDHDQTIGPFLFPTDRIDTMRQRAIDQHEQFGKSVEAEASDRP